MAQRTAKALNAGDAFDRFIRRAFGLDPTEFSPLKDVIMDFVEQGDRQETLITDVQTTVSTIPGATFP